MADAISNIDNHGKAEPDNDAHEENKIGDDQNYDLVDCQED